MVTSPLLNDGPRTVIRGDGAQTPTFVLVHGFLDGADVWSGVTDALGDDVRTLVYDLPGSGARNDDTTPQSLEDFVTEALVIVDGVDGPVVMVGQSMGAQIAELAATRRADKIIGLVLLSPVPLGGTNMPEDAVAPFKSMGGRLEIQRQVRRQLSPALTSDNLDVLDTLGALPTAATVAKYVDIWNAGDSSAPEQTKFPGQVLIIRGGSDGFVTEELARGVVEPRFPDARIEVAAGGGHWLHVEQPGLVAGLLSDFAGHLTGTATSGWRSAFADKSSERFGDGFTEDAVLEATVLTMPLTGRETVATALGVASGIYESLEFTAEAVSGATSYLQWAATAWGGEKLSGITILTKDSDGRISHAAIHHRPLSAALKFSAELRRRLDGQIDAGHFYSGDPGTV
ncbi:alpha/beta fold hydrolase [Actinomycetes bacterium M1A6_2h]